MDEQGRRAEAANKALENYAEAVAKFVVHLKERRKKVQSAQLFAMDESAGNRYDDVDAIFHAVVAATNPPDQQLQSPSSDENKLLQLSIPEICEGSPKAVLSMCWQLVQIYWRRFAPTGAKERKVAEALKDWCLEATGKYEEVVINDFTSSWRDGVAINILIMSFDESLVNLKQVRELREMNE
uniref:Calponin-homology (CH) domain-containing protein n=1 Tax=Ditylenchus dipsaci TaxID=166011 RepID=A0A915DV00_9BILA